MFLDQLSCKNTETQTKTHTDTSVQKALECRNIQASGKKRNTCIYMNWPIHFPLKHISCLSSSNTYLHMTLT